ncbi:GNAT family N-acetyltransferase [Methylosinus sp. PW1]|uniref:GNAT family N-acetyltransferase n=1 Tax=Methylosinus sp. PW1 TaxID=107636 RepID=UPI00056526F3|nr:GNAT family N-acetyltransferase [Methylosinus sp. PW1]
MEDIVIRPAVLADAARMSALILHSVRETNASDYSSDIIDLICANFTAERIIQKMAVRDVFVATLETEIAGTVSLGAAKLHSLFVEPKRQGRGIGSRLVDYLERHAAANEIDVLHVHSSITARHFYEKRGYAFLEFEPRADGSTYLMRKAIRGP